MDIKRSLSAVNLRGFFFIFYSVACLGSSCKATTDSSVIINGSGFEKKILKIYLTKRGEILDSTNCIDGKFNMIFKPNGKFEPFLASLCYLDSNKMLNAFSVRNEYEIKKDGKNHSHSNFMLDYGTTSFTYFGFNYEVNLVNIKGGAEEHLFQNYSDIGGIPNASNSLRKEYVNNIISLIKTNPYSYFLLGRIIENRYQYSKDELEKILDIFDDDVQNSLLAMRLKDHLANTLDSGESTRSLNLISDKKIRKININKTAKLNMLIFWASWCGPCRMEIPELKKINQIFSDKDFYMASISIDANENDWKKALTEEGLKWDQFIVDADEKDKIKSQYAFTSIPIVVFTNKDGKELQRFVGYDLGNTKRYKKVIENYLNKPLPK